MSIEWNNQNELSRYPFAEGVSLNSSKGGSTIQNGDIVDMLVYSLNETDTDFYLSSISLAGSTLKGTVTIFAPLDAITDP